MAIDRILVVDPEQDVREFVQTALSDWDCEVSLAGGALEAVGCGQPGSFDLILAAPEVAGPQWVSWLEQLRQRSPDSLVVPLLGSSHCAAEPTDSFSILHKPLSREALFVVLERAERHTALLAFARHLVEEQHRQAVPLVAFSARMRQTIAEAQRLAWSGLPILIHGERGTELGSLARFMHDRSPVAEGLFLNCDCAVESEELEGRLFGRDGAGAARREPGLIELAAAGTLFIDRIEHCREPLQGKLLRLIEEGSYQRVEGARELPCQARIIAAASREIYAAVANGMFRKDLFFRFGPATLEMPPLRERPEDLPGLAAVILRQLGVSPELLGGEILERLQSYPWPGNTSELRSVLEAAVLRSNGRTLPVGALVLPEPQAGSTVAPLAEVEREHLRRALEHARGSRSRAARLLGISVQSLGARLRQYGLSPAAAPAPAAAAHRPSSHSKE